MAPLQVHCFDVLRHGPKTSGANHISSSPGHLQSQPLTRHSQASHPTLFEKHSAEATGVHFVHPFNTDHPKSYLYYESYTTGGIAIGDINQDQKPDLFFAGSPVSNALFEQVDPFNFTNTFAGHAPPPPPQPMGDRFDHGRYRSGWGPGYLCL